MPESLRPSNNPRTTPSWLGRAWRLRAAMLAAVFALVAALIYGRLQLAEVQAAASGGAAAGPAAWRALLVLLGWGAASAIAARLDWLWLQRNHHRVNSWGLSKGRDARNRPS